MNFSRNVNLLKTIDDTLDDKIYVGVTESKVVLDAIDNNLVLIDGVLDSIKVDTNAANTYLANIETSVSNNDSSLNAIEASSANIDASLNAVESDVNELNAKVADLGVTISRGNKFNLTQKFQPLRESGANRLLSAGDFSTTPGRMYWENNTGKSVAITKISCTYSSSETTWDEFFTSSTDGQLLFGIADDANAITTQRLSFKSNHEIQPYMSMVFADPAGGDEMYYSYVIDGLNIKLDDGKYFMSELSGTYNAAGDGSFCSSIFYDQY